MRTLDDHLEDLQKLEIKLSMTRCAIEAQARDDGLWCDSQNIGEAYLQESLRDLHAVVENSDDKALSRIYERLNG